jgi:hypothetical protein
VDPERSDFGTGVVTSADLVFKILTEICEKLFTVQSMFHKVLHMVHMFLKLVKHFILFKFD